MAGAGAGSTLMSETRSGKHALALENCIQIRLGFRFLLEWRVSLDLQAWINVAVIVKLSILDKIEA